MIRKIAAFVVLATMVACGSSKSPIQTTKSSTARAKNQRERAKASHTRTSKTATASNNKKDENPVVLEATSKTVTYSEQVNAYINNYKGIAQNNMKKHGIPASIILAQGILESGAGRGDLASNANNHFGIKCHNDWTGDKVYHDDDSAQECFRKYPSAAGSFEDHALFLTTRGRYASLFKLDKDDYKGWAKGLKAAGYATDPKYPDKLIGLIERFELNQYDEEVLGGKYTPTNETRKNVPLPATVKDPVATTPAPTSPKTTIQQAASQPIANNIGANDSYTVVQGDTLYSISKKHNTTVDELIRLNNLSGNALSIGQVLKVR